MTTTVLNTKISEVEKKIPNHDKYITTPEFNKLTSGSFAARLKQANLVSKTNFDNKVTSFNRLFTSNKTKHLEVQKKLDSLITKDYSFLLGRRYFTLELKKDKGRTQTEYLILNLSYYILLSCIV